MASPESFPRIRHATVMARFRARLAHHCAQRVDISVDTGSERSLSTTVRDLRGGELPSGSESIQSIESMLSHFAIGILLLFFFKK